jgi:hypothetical protein
MFRAVGWGEGGDKVRAVGWGEGGDRVSEC